MYRTTRVLILTTMLVAGFALPASGADPPAPASLSDIWTKAKLELDLRTRVEFGDQDGLNEALASTARLRAGVRTGSYLGLQAFAELENNQVLNKDRFNAAGVHGDPTKTVIAEPESFELNRAWLQYEFGNTAAKVGRQRIVLDDSRFIGNVIWRQNEQTYDAVSLKSSPFENVNLFYAYVLNVHRIFGSRATERNWDSHSHFINASYTVAPWAKLTAFSYLLDIEGRGSADAGSNNTHGVRLTGSTNVGEAKISYQASFARQSDAADNPASFDASYIDALVTIGYGGYSLGAGYELLGEDGGRGFSTPLATLHKFNGFADKFLTTPADGLADAYLVAGAKLPFGVNLKAWYHDFSADRGGNDYGYEFDFVISRKFTKNISGLAKLAFYEADDAAPNFGLTDTQRMIFQIDWRWAGP